MFFFGGAQLWCCPASLDENFPALCGLSSDPNLKSPTSLSKENEKHTVSHHPFLSSQKCCGLFCYDWADNLFQMCSLLLPLYKSDLCCLAWVKHMGWKWNWFVYNVSLTTEPLSFLFETCTDEPREAGQTFFLVRFDIKASLNLCDYEILPSAGCATAQHVLHCWLWKGPFILKGSVVTV